MDKVAKIIDDAEFTKEDIDSGTTEFCGSFALALYRRIISLSPQIVLLGFEHKGKIRKVSKNIPAWRHVAVKVGGKYYDIEGEQKVEWMKENYGWGSPFEPVIIPVSLPEFITIMRDHKPATDWRFYTYCKKKLAQDEELTETINPSIKPAIRHNGKIYVGDTHFSALDKILDKGVRGRASLDGNTRGFVDERGRWMDRRKAALYARNFDLYDKSHPDWERWMDNNPELISEIPLKKQTVDEGYRLPLAKGMIPMARGSYGAFIITMHAEDFLRLTTPDVNVLQQIKDRPFPDTREEYFADGGHETDFGRFWMPYLNVAFPTGKVLGHEGRHRAAMVLRNGGDLIPVTIYPRTGEEWLANVRYWTSDGNLRTLASDDAFPTKGEAIANLEAKIAELGIDEDDLQGIKTDFIGHSTLKGEPNRSEGWDKAKWLPSDFPDQLVGQYRDSVVIPRNHLKIGLVKGYHHFRR